ncbi:MAG: helix-turn-helix transcriptional regulator [Sphingobium sp.]|nr:helix-turn-helix transcriptional regulator [Sphingobium sp.]
MLEIDLNGALRVSDPAQAASFGNPLRCRLLVACVHEELSLSQLQKRFGVPLSKLHYHIGQLLDVGLIAVSRTQPRAGRPIRLYRAIAGKFLVPHAFLADAPGENFATELRQLLRDENDRDDELSLLYAPAADGNLRIRLVRSEDAEPARAFERWRLMKLNPGQRAALAQELSDVIERHAALDPAVGGETYLVHAAFAPRGPEPGN